MVITSTSYRGMLLDLNPSLSPSFITGAGVAQALPCIFKNGVIWWPVLHGTDAWSQYAQGCLSSTFWLCGFGKTFKPNPEFNL